MDVERVDREIAYLNKVVKISCMYPENYEKEKKLVLQDKNHEPLFYYKKYKYDLNSIRDKLMGLKIDRGQHVLLNLLDEKRDELLKMVDMVMNIGKKDFARKSI